MKLSVHIVTSGRDDLFRRCCLSVIEALPRDSEVVVILNGKGRVSEPWLTSLSHPAFRWVTVESELLSASRNRAFSLCRGEIVYCLDDDVTVPASLFHEALARFDSDRDLVILGGPNLTPPGSRWIERAFGAVMTSWFAAPLVRSRYRCGTTRPATEHDLIFCNLAFRRRAIPSLLRFHEELKSNQENLFLFEATRHGLKTEADGRLYVYHRRRPTLKAFASQIASYGAGRVQQTLASWRSCHPLFLIPALWIPFFGVSLVAIPFRSALLPAALLYVFLASLAAMQSAECRRTGAIGVLFMIPLTLLVHLSYGCGMWRALFREVKSRFQFALARMARAMAFPTID